MNSLTSMVSSKQVRLFTSPTRLIHLVRINRSQWIRPFFTTSVPEPTDSSSSPTVATLTHAHLDALFDRLQKLQRRRIQSPANGKRAAVLVPLCTYNNEAALLYTKRSSSLGSHKGEVAFPGGYAEEGEEDPEIIATREAHEECGLGGDVLSPTIELMGLFHDVMARANVAVTPVVGYIGTVTDEQLRKMAEFNTDEIADVFVLTISQLLDKAHVHDQLLEFNRHESAPLPPSTSSISSTTTTTTLPSDATEPSTHNNNSKDAATNHKLRVKSFTAGPYPVWGLTAFITNELLRSVLVGSNGIWPHLSAD